MLVGGLRALLIQATNPLAMAGVDQHSDYLVDPWGRLRRTTEFVMTATFGTRDEAEGLGAVVRRVHETVRGVDPWTGESYCASDPALLAWVHNVLVHSFLTAYRRYGGSLSPSEMDGYVDEMVGMAALVGLAPGDVPHDMLGLRAYLRDAGPLEVTPAARRGVKTILAPPMPLALRPVWAVPAIAAVSLLPARVRSLYGFVWFPPAEPGVRLTTAALVRSLRLVLPDPPPIRSARARLAA